LPKANVDIVIVRSRIQMEMSPSCRAPSNLSLSLDPCLQIFQR
jgi:hypothetical protein